MMYISGHGSRTSTWHVGETLKIPDARVITFQADGHELDILIDALRDSGITVEFQES